MVILNAADEDLDLMVTRMEAKQAQIKFEKKMKKSVKKEPIGLTQSEENTETASTVTSKEQTKIAVKNEPLSLLIAKPAAGKLLQKGK